MLVGADAAYTFEPVGALRLRGLSDSFPAEEVAWELPGTSTQRVVLADDAVILRRGLARLLQDEGFRIVGEAGDADELLQLVDELRPDVVVTDIRMPPHMSLDGLEAALEIRRRFPQIGILLLSQHIEAEYAMRLLGDDATGVGYLLKERISAVDAFASALHRVSAGGTAVDPEVVDALMHRATKGDPLSALSERERQVLSLMAEGMSNAGIAERLVVSQRTVESHVASIFTKLDMLPESRDDRRVLAVVRDLEARR
jgi:DNA-binding NarL/FixJ family response regulator